MGKTDSDITGPCYQKKRYLSGKSSTLSLTLYIQRGHISGPRATPVPPADIL